MIRIFSRSVVHGRCVLICKQTVVKKKVKGGVVGCEPHCGDLAGLVAGPPRRGPPGSLCVYVVQRDNIMDLHNKVA